MRIAALLVVVLAGVQGAGAEPPPFDGSRAALEIPDDVWKSVLEAGGRPGGVIGYTSDQMRDFGKDTHLLKTVQGLFRDVRKIPRETGRITDGLLDNAMKPSEVIARGYALTDVHAGRMYEPPKDLKWGLAELEYANNVDDALAGVATFPLNHGETALPAAVKRLALDLYVAIAVATPWVRRAAPPGAGFGAVAAEKDAWEAGLAAVTAPWREETNGQTATQQILHIPEPQRRASMAYGSVLLLVHVERAIERYRAAPESERGPRVTRSLGIPTELGTFWIGDADASRITMDGRAVVIDTGGDDTIEQAAVGSTGLDQPLISLYVDLEGNDTYRGRSQAALAAGVFGIGVLVDLAGDDTYDAKGSSLGCGLYGTGVLWDLAGNDSYRSRGPWGQGCGHVGVGALIDMEGDDEYDCVEQAQGLGGTLGAGLLVDVKGNDTYLARDDGNVSALYLNQSVAMAQGCGYGRRADIGDGHSLAGGVGILVDGAGDDRYHAQVWSQGCAYWWSLGILEDRGGNDQYQNGKYSAGAAAHFAIGVCVDLAGDDRHNERNTTAKNQYQGHARDGSIGVFVDGDGDDTYDVNNHCAGAADLNSIGLFWDRRGDDLYTFHDQALGAPNGWNDTGAFGVASRYTPFRSFRDDLPSWGLFLDTGGKDVYASDPAPKDCPATPAAEGKSWKTFPGPLVFGLGFDVDAFAPAPR